MPSPTCYESSSIWPIPVPSPMRAGKRRPHAGLTAPACGTVAVADAVPDHATSNVMGSILYPTVILATMLALQIPALAQVNPSGVNPSGVNPNGANPGAPPQQTPVPGPPQSQAPPSPPQDADNPRYAFHRIEGGFVRLDLRTGELASCTPKGADWNCAPGREERAALDREIARLQRDNAVLKNALLERGVPLPEGMAPNPPAAGTVRPSTDEPIPRPPQTVPPTATAPAAQDDEINRVMTAVEKGWRRLVEMVTNLQRDLQKKE